MRFIKLSLLMISAISLELESKKQDNRDSELPYFYAAGWWHPEFIGLNSLRVMGGIASNVNVFGGIGFAYSFVLKDTLLNCKLALVASHRHVHFDDLKDSLKKIGLMLDVYTEILGLYLGLSVILNFGKKEGSVIDVAWMFHCAFNVTENLELNIGAIPFGSSALLKNDSTNLKDAKRLMADYQKIIDKFESYLKNEYGCEVTPEVLQTAQTFVKDAKRKYELLKKFCAQKISEEELFRVRPKEGALFTIGMSGSGKNFVTESLFRAFFKKENIIMPVYYIDAGAVRPSGYHGNSLDDLLQLEIESVLKDSEASIFQGQFGYFFIDEFDGSISLGESGGSDDFKASGQKEYLPVIEGKKELHLKSGGKFRLSNVTRCLMGSFEKKQKHMFNHSLQAILDDFSIAFDNSVDYLFMDFQNSLLHSSACDRLEQSLRSLGQLINEIFAKNTKEISAEDPQKAINMQCEYLYDFLKEARANHEKQSFDAHWRRLNDILDNIQRCLDQLPKLIYQEQEDYKEFLGSFRFYLSKRKEDFMSYMRTLVVFSILQYQGLRVEDMIRVAGVGEEAVRRSEKSVLIKPMTEFAAARYFKKQISEQNSKYSILQDRKYIGDLDLYVKAKIKQIMKRANLFFFRFNDLTPVLKALEDTFSYVNKDTTLKLVGHTVKLLDDDKYYSYNIAEVVKVYEAALNQPQLTTHVKNNINMYYKSYFEELLEMLQETPYENCDEYNAELSLCQLVLDKIKKTLPKK